MAIPKVRTFDVDLTGVPRHWVASSAVATAISNGINLLFPRGERFFVRSVHHFADRIEDPTLRAEIKLFVAQEGHHAAAHDDCNAVIRSHGFAIDDFLARYRGTMRWVERHVPAKLRLAGTAAAEHFTAILAQGAFENGVLDLLDPRMQQLLAWHAAEEIEHKAVAFDVLRAIDPSYALRITGLALATLMLGVFWSWATAMLLRQERLGWRAVLRGLREVQAGDPVVRGVFLRGIRQYLRRDFHPRDNPNEHLAAAWFAARGLSLDAA